MFSMSIFKRDSNCSEAIRPEEYFQDPEDCIVRNGTYDYTRLSQGENETVMSVLRVAVKKYLPEQRALGLASEASTIKYKARAILNEIVVQAYHESVSPLDVLAVAFAYQTKGAAGRQNAILYFEKYLNATSEQIAIEAQHIIFDAREPFFSYKLAELYEQEGLWSLALKYAIKAQNANTDCAPAFPLLVGKIYRHIDPFKSQKYLQELMKDKRYQAYTPIIQKEVTLSTEWFENAYAYTPKPYRPSRRVLQMENDIKGTASKYLEAEKALLLGAEGHNG